MWMARPDLPEGMGGWQAIDGTPQEESAGNDKLISLKVYKQPSSVFCLNSQDVIERGSQNRTTIKIKRVLCILLQK